MIKKTTKFITKSAIYSSIFILGTLVQTQFDIVGTIGRFFLSFN